MRPVHHVHQLHSINPCKTASQTRVMWTKWQDTVIPASKCREKFRSTAIVKSYPKRDENRVPEEIIYVDSASSDDRSQYGNDDQRRNREHRNSDRFRNFDMNRELDDEGLLIDHVIPILIGYWKICFSGDTPPAKRIL